MVYQYRPLDIANNEIRLLTVSLLNVAEESTPRVQCDLTHHSLGANFPRPVFSALSYVWGSLSDTVDIYIDGHPTPVTRNLYEALKQLATESCGPLWIDALCINQKDVKERGDQVLRMAEIYSGAEQVVAWLGAAQLGDEDVFGLVHRLWREIFDPQYTKEELAGQVLDNPEWVKTCQAMGRFCQVTYWHRVWIIQEVALARTLEFRRGHLRCSKDQLFNAVDVSPFGTFGTDRRENWEDVLSGAEYEAMQTVRGLRNVAFSMERGGQPLLYYLWMASLMHSVSTDLRDRVYGMLGLAKDRAVLVSKVDYTATNTLSAMLTKLTESYVDDKRLFDVILLQNWNGRSNKETPSWVPDFLNMSKSVPRHLDQMKQDLQHPFDCRIGFPKSVTNRIGVDGNILRLHTLVYDTVLSLGRVREVEELEPSFVDVANSVANLNLSDVTSDTAEVAPTPVGSPYDSEGETYRAILAAIERTGVRYQSCDWIGLALCKMWDQTEDFHRNLLGSGDTHTVADTMLWLKQNSSFPVNGRSLREWTELHRDGNLSGAHQTIITQEHMRTLQRTLSSNYYARRRLVYTAHGYVGNVHGCTQIHDKFAIAACGVPLILREKAGRELEFELVGDAYISGMMWGEKHAKVASAAEWKIASLV